MSVSDCCKRHRRAGFAGSVVLPVASLVVLLVSLLATTVLSAEALSGHFVPSGAIAGQVIDVSTARPLPGATVRLEGSPRVTGTDSSGHFLFAVVPAGSYQLRVSSVGYKTAQRSDVIARSGRTTRIVMGLAQSVTTVEGAVVSGGYFSQPALEHPGTVSYNTEEIRRSPGSAGDVSRVMQNHPGVFKNGLAINHLIVRGGSPTENAFYLDNIQIPNINHYPVFGTTGGAISLLNPDFIEEATFYAGGFPASYGGRLSSVMALRFREGSREQTVFQTDMGLSGLGAIGEGPLGRGRGSWMLAARRSYLDVLTEALGVGILPRFSDYQGKVVWDVGRSHRVSVLGILGVDDVTIDRHHDVSIYGTTEAYEYTLGVNWRWLWGQHGVSEFSLSQNATDFELDYRSDDNKRQQILNRQHRRSTQVRSVNRWRPGRMHQLELGGEYKWTRHEVDLFDYEDMHPFGYPPINVVIADTVSDNSSALFATYTLRPNQWLDLSLGARFDRFEYTRVGHVGPRLSAGLALTESTRLKAAYGVYYQQLPMLMLMQREKYRELPSLQAKHLVVGLEHRPAANTRLTLEAYHKVYDDFPMDRSTPELFIADEVVYRYGYSWFQLLTDSGEARSYGVELVCQSKLVSRVHGFVGLGWSRAEYRGLDGQWRDRVTDSRLMLTAQLGVRPGAGWDMGLRFVYAGGTPYTPMRLATTPPYQFPSIQWWQWDRSRVNESRNPPYHSLDVRVDRRFQFSGSNLIVYVSVWNVFNHANKLSGYSEFVDSDDLVLGIVPIVGVEFEF
jgi:hypothetical protein